MATGFPSHGIKAGGLGIRRVSSLALPAFLASAAGTLPLQSSMLRYSNTPMDPEYQAMLNHWQAETKILNPDNTLIHKQSFWDKPLLDRVVNDVHASATDAYNQARLKAVSAPHSGDWLYALPITACGLRLDDEAIRIATGLRLGTCLCEPHNCMCGAMVTADGSHGLSCSLGPSRIARHSVLNDLICRCLIRAGFPAIKEPPGLSRTDGKRPDGLTLIPWRSGRTLIWDATVTDTVAASYLPATSVMAGAAAELAATRKEAKYGPLLATHVFVPLALETLGPINRTGLAFISELGQNLTRISGDPRETSHLFQRLSIVIQRFNAVAYRSTFDLPELDDV